MKPLVAIVGRPVSRYLDDGLTLEVNRLCITSEKIVCSFLYSIAVKVGKNGLQTKCWYILN